MLIEVTDSYVLYSLVCCTNKLFISSDQKLSEIFKRRLDLFDVVFLQVKTIISLCYIFLSPLKYSLRQSGCRISSVSILLQFFNIIVIIITTIMIRSKIIRIINMTSSELSFSASGLFPLKILSRTSSKQVFTKTTTFSKTNIHLIVQPVSNSMVMNMINEP